MHRNRRVTTSSSTLRGWQRQCRELKSKNNDLRIDLRLAKAKTKAIRVRIEMVNDGESCYTAEEAVADIKNILRGGKLWTKSPQYAVVKKSL